MLRTRTSRAALSMACAALLLTTSACGSDEPEEAPATQVRLYGTDGNMLNSYPAELKDRADLVNGMKGTTPLTPLPESFKERLLALNPKLVDFLYSAEAYDAVVISALAAQVAGTTEPREIAKQIVGVTTGGQRCEKVATCLQLARAGEDIEYRGVALSRAGFTDKGEPAAASYGTMHFDNQKIDDSKTEFVGAGDESGASVKTPPPGRKVRGKAKDAPLVLGGLLPKTGDLALAYPQLAAGATLAVNEVNAAGGVLGEPVKWVEGDDGTNPATAKATVAAHVSRGVHVIIGAGASGISRAVLPDVVAAGRILFSPSNTDAGLSSVEDQGLYFRTAPPDSLQGRALADVMLRDGPRKIAILARGDSYGEGLQQNVRAELEKAGIGSDRVKLLTYPPPADPKTPVDFAGAAQEIKSFAPEALLLIGFGETAPAITALADAGLQIKR
ncbi:ABC transporter substrate-binding protein [Micromonospora sp. DT31]|uniref:ABC transporter substrate-binding protein n=1 Tax=Micromonospora sp. DT31 TaxID=3393434 RepID=UPI003CE89BA8